MIYIIPWTVDQNKPSVLYENVFLQGSILTSGYVDGFQPENAVSGTTWDYWLADSDWPTYAVSDLPDNTTVDCLFIDAHNISDLGTGIKIAVSDDNFNTPPEEVTPLITPIDNSPILVLIPEVSGNSFAVFFQGDQPTIGVMMLGKRLVFPNGIDARYLSFQHSKRYDLLGGNSLGGQFLGQKVVRKGGNTNVTFPLLDADWVDTTMKPFEEHYNIGKPFAFAPNPAFRDNDLAYCWRPDNASELQPTYLENGLYEDFTMEVDFFNG